MRCSDLISFAAGILMSSAPAMAIVDIVVETRVFHTPGGSSRTEVNMAFLAGSMVSIPDGRGFYSSQIEATTLIEQNGKVIKFAKSVVASNPSSDSTTVDMIHQEFFELDAGNYELNIQLRDLNNLDTTATRYSGLLVVGTLDKEISISELLLAERIEKAAEGEASKFGYNVIPLLSDYLPKEIDRLNFYAEVYGTDQIFGKDSSYALTYQIETFESRAVFGNMKKIIRGKARAIEPIMAEFDISQLPSGNYMLAIEVLDRAGVLRARKDLFFQRNNKVTVNYDLAALNALSLENTFVGGYTDRDTLAEYIASLRPIADPLERKIIDDRWKDRDLDLMQRFFYSFWANRSNEPAEKWKIYHTEVIKVNKLYSCRNMPGHQTDMGNVYLKYGPPNTQMDRFNEMDTYPYSIWHYYRAGRYTNKRFIFYQPDLISNCLLLLHSEVPGEIKNPRWNQILHERNVPNNNVDVSPVNTYGGERADEFFDQPR